MQIICAAYLHTTYTIMYKYAKDGVSVLTVLDTRRSLQDGKCPVKVQIIFRRIQKYYSTGKSLSSEEWQSLPTTKSHRLLDIREDIENSFNIIRDEVRLLVSNGEFSFEALNMRLKGASSDTINTAFHAKIELLRQGDRIGNMLIYDNTLKSVERFAGQSIPYITVTKSWIERYADFLIKEGKAQTTIAIHLRTIRAILNDAKRNGIIKESQYPFGRGRYEIQAGEGRKLALTLEQIGLIANYEDGTKATAKYRDYWLFLYLCNGINVADFVKLKYKDITNGEICFIRQKTERTSRKLRDIRVILTPPMQAIIAKWGNPAIPDNYIFPFLTGQEDALTRKNKSKSLTHLINRRMSAIGESLGIGKITTYTARHSFATVLKRSGASISYISESLGHTDLKTTENYLASFEREEREKNAALLTQF